jgi:hypothetical protein
MNVRFFEWESWKSTIVKKIIDTHSNLKLRYICEDFFVPQGGGGPGKTKFCRGEEDADRLTPGNSDNTAGDFKPAANIAQF